MSNVQSNPLRELNAKLLVDVVELRKKVTEAEAERNGNRLLKRMPSVVLRMSSSRPESKS